jgi:excinuclease ABC subunit C
MIQEIRDEAHRFAVTFHRQRRKANRIRSELTGIPGIGQKTSHALLRSFGSVKRVRSASEEELRSVVSASQAAAVRQYFAPSE